MFTFTIRPDQGEEYDLQATSRDVYVWERSGRDRTLRQFAESVSVESCYQLAHIAARRQQVFHGTLEDFAATHDLDFHDDDQEDPDPTRPGLSPGS